VIEGATLVRVAAAAGLALEAVFAERDAPPLDDLPIPVTEVETGALARVASTVTPQPVLAVAARCDTTLGALAPGATFLVVGAGLSDPGNVGTILRSAEAAGADAVVLTQGSVDVFNPKVVRASAGALFHVPVVVDATADAVGRLALRRFGAVAAGGIPYDEAPFGEPCAVVLGNETRGLPDGFPLDDLVTVPHAGRAESLNVAMAATLLCFEVMRRRR
jgi:TrmH family RNA methyltransferase